MGLVAFARDELERAGLFKEDSDYGGMLGKAVLDLIEKFADEGHSGMSAELAVSLFEKLARWEPLTPLTGADDEWGPPFDDRGTVQNRRCSHVFKDADGRAYDIHAVVFEDPDGSRWTNGDSHRTIEFPYVPKSEIVKRAGA